MSSTTFVDQVTPVPASWLNDVNTATYTSSSVPSLTALTSVNGGQLAGLRNRIINGGMQVAQRGTSGVVAGAYTVDRWLVYSAGSAPTWSQSLGVIPTSNAGYFLSINGIAGNTLVSLAQRIEATNSMDLAGKTVTISYWVYQTTGTTVGAYAAISYATAGSDNFNTTSASTNGGTVSVANSTWVRYSAQIVVPVGGTTGLNIALFPLGGTALLGSQVFSIYGVQLEIGSVATPFEQRPYGLELALCQRYYEILPNIQFVAYSSSGNYIGQTHPFKVTKRAVPTVSGTSSYANTSGMSTTPSIDGIYTIALVTALGAASWQYTNVSASAEL